jgi:hypothetical protein
MLSITVKKTAGFPRKYRAVLLVTKMDKKKQKKDGPEVALFGQKS